MVSLGADYVIKVWDLKRFKTYAEIPSPQSAGNLSKAVWCGQSLIVSSNSGVIRQYENIPTTSTTTSTAAEEGGKDKNEWVGRDLTSHTQASTDLISTENFVASSSKSGQILRWNL